MWQRCRLYHILDINRNTTTIKTKAECFCIKLKHKLKGMNLCVLLLCFVENNSVMSLLLPSFFGIIYFIWIFVLFSLVLSTAQSNAWSLKVHILQSKFGWIWFVFHFSFCFCSAPPIKCILLKWKFCGRRQSRNAYSHLVSAYSHLFRWMEKVI